MTVLSSHGLAAKVVAHADFGRATLAAHVWAVQDVNIGMLTPSNALHCCLLHVIALASNTYCQEIEALPVLEDPPRSPIYHLADLLHPTGLWDVTRPKLHIGC